MSKTRHYVQSRPDGIPQPWEFTLHCDIEEQNGLWEVVDRLIEIPVHPLPDPLVSSNRDWRETLNVSQFDFYETWEAYLKVLQEYGEILHSSFCLNPPVNDAEITPPREKHGARIITCLLGDWAEDLFVWTTIFATGRVNIVVYEEDLHSAIMNVNQ